MNRKLIFVLVLLAVVVAALKLTSAQHYENFQKSPVHYPVQDATDQVPGGRLQHGTPVEYDPGSTVRLQPAYQNQGE